jgi:POT family proton-dependent oligopeptide transporter
MSDAGAATSPDYDRSFFGHPRSLSTLFFSEMWERFSYYGMRALLILFLVDAVSKGGFGLDDKTAAAIYGLYTAAVYVVCLPGGWIADRLIGTQAAALWGGVIIAIGHLLLGFSGSAASLFYFGLCVIVVGTGLLKPNLSALVAQLYPEGGYRRDAGFTMYYMAVNLGGFLGPLVTAWLAKHYGWHAGFFAAAFGMILGIAYFVWTRDRLGQAGRAPAPPTAGKSALDARRWLTWIGVAIVALLAIVWSGAIRISPIAMQSGSTWVIVAVSAAYFLYLFFIAELNTLERKRAVMMLVLFLACALFWSGFEQAGSSFNLFADRYTRLNLGSFAVPAGWLQSLNSLFIIIFAPIFASLWVRLGVRNLDPSAPVKFTLGLLGMALGFLILAAAARLVAAGNTVSMGWLTTVYLIHTFGELCLSPVGLSVFTKLAPVRLVGQSLGVWFMGTALGNLIAARIAGEFDANNLPAMPGQLMRIFWFGVISAAALLVVGLAVNRWIKSSEKEQAHAGQ